MAVQSASLSDQGRRKNNEDFVAFYEPTDPAELKQSGCLYIVADGVGGAARGERASQFAAQKILYEYYQSTIPDPLERLQTIIKRVNDDIFAFASQNHTRMATTLVTVVVRGGYLYAANVGDSRAYVIREASPIQVTHDHSIVGEMVKMGEMSEEEAMASKIKNRLTRSLGGDEEVSVETYPPLALQTGDKILLCSDGLTRYALRDDLKRMSSKSNDPAEIAREMIRFANSKGGADNISVVMVSYVGESRLEPTIRIERPKQVDLDTLLTQPGESIRSYRKRRTALTVSWLVVLVGAVIAVALIGLIFGGALVEKFFPAENPIQASEPSSAPQSGPTTVQLTTDIFSSPTMAPNNPTHPADVPTTPTYTPIPTIIKVVAPDGSTLTAKNSCDKVYVYKEQNPPSQTYDGIISPALQLIVIPDAVVNKDETIKLTGIAKPGQVMWGEYAVDVFWFESTGPFNSLTYSGLGWIYQRAGPRFCLKFFQGTNAMQFNPSTLKFELAPPETNSNQGP